MISSELEARAEATGPEFSDSVTFSWADRAAGICGLARIGLAPGGLASALCLLFADGEPVSALASGGVEIDEDASWEALAVGGLRAGIDEPLRRWRLGCDFADGNSVALSFEALGAPADGSLGGLRGYEQLCVAAGTVRVGGAERNLRCLGQRGHTWGEPGWDRTELTRNLSAWLDDGMGVSLATARPAGARSHADEAVRCSLLGGEAAAAVADPRLSTTYDGEGRQLRAGLELWMGDEDGYPHRGAGRAFCGSTLDLGALQLDCAFFDWSVDGRRGVGRYDILRRA